MDASPLTINVNKGLGDGGGNKSFMLLSQLPESNDRHLTLSLITLLGHQAAI